MTGNILQFERLSGDDEKTSVFVIPVSRRARINARLDIFLHRQQAPFWSVFGLLWGGGVLSTGAIIVVASHSPYRLSYAPIVALGFALVALLPLLMFWRTRRECGRPATPEEVAALRELIQPRHWEAIVAANAASYGRSSDRLVTIGEILGRLDQAEAAAKLLSPEHREATAAQRRAFGS